MFPSGFVTDTSFDRWIPHLPLPLLQERSSAAFHEVTATAVQLSSVMANADRPPNEEEMVYAQGLVDRMRARAAELGALRARSGTLPTDRESAIRQLIDVAKGERKQREAMRIALDGQQQALLEDLGWALMQAESTAIAEGQLLPLLATSLDRLRAAHKLFVPVTPPQVLDQLLADSILTANGEPGGRDIALIADIPDASQITAGEPFVPGADCGCNRR